MVLAVGRPCFERKTSMKLLRVLLTTGLFASVALASPFQNGNFASPGGGPPFQQILGCNDSFVTGWVNDALNCAGLQVYRSDGYPGVQFGVGLGGYYVSFGNNSTTGGTLQQTFDTVVGKLYSVQFQVALENTAVEPQSMEVQAFAAGGGLLGIQTDNNFVNFPLAFGPTLTFTATSTSTTLVFTDTTPAGPSVNNWGLTNVSVTTTPEPGTACLFSLVAIVALAAIRLRTRGMGNQ
jgi:hypothetical protein